MSIRYYSNKKLLEQLSKVLRQKMAKGKVDRRKEGMSPTQYVHRLKALKPQKNECFSHFFCGMHQIDNALLKNNRIFATVSLALRHIGK